MAMLRLVYYVSGHGLGHAVRTTEIIKALMEKAPDLEIQIRTTVSPGFFFNTLNPCPEIVELPGEAALDVGMVQRDSLTMDLPATLKQVQHLLKGAKNIIRRESRALQAFGTQFTVGDAPFLAPAAADCAGLPAVVVSNFTWDWIYEAYTQTDPGWEPAIREIRSYYQLADLVIQLPFSPNLSKRFPRVRPVGLTGRRAGRSRSAIRKAIGVDPEERLLLLTFTDLALSSAALGKMADSRNGFKYVFSNPLNFSGPGFIKVDDRRIFYADLVGAVDAVLTKPGYGIVADCLVNRTPMIFTDRGDFPEYPLLVRAIESFLPHRYIPSFRLYAGETGPYLTDLKAPMDDGPMPWDLNGAETAAELILKEGGILF